MRKTILLVLACALCQTALGAELTLERLYEDPRLFGAAPRAVQWSPAGPPALAFLWNEKAIRARDLWIVDPMQGTPRKLVSHTLLGASEGPLDDAVAERKITARLVESGIDGFSWSPDGSRLLIEAFGDLFSVKRDGSALTRLVRTDAPEIDPSWIPDGSGVAFVRDNDLWLATASGQQIQLTTDGSPTVINARSDYIALEEIGLRRAYSFSPSGETIGFIRYDVSPVEVLEIPDYLGKRVTTRKQRRPPAGTVNSKVKVGMVTANGSRTTWVQIPEELGEDFYVVHMSWLDDGRMLLGLQPRDLKSLHITLVDKNTGRTRIVRTEEDAAWINLDRSWIDAIDEDTILFGSESSGFGHLYRLDAIGGRATALTSGSWEVVDLQGVENDHVVFKGNRGDPHQQHLFRVPKAGGLITQLTAKEGWHSASLSSDGRFVATIYSTFDQPPDLWVGPAGSPMAGRRITSSPAGDYDPSMMMVPKVVRYPSGDSMIPALLYEPPGVVPPEGRAAMVYVHGAGYTQAVRHAFSGRRAIHSMMARAGIPVISIDYRGSRGYGRDWRTSVHLNLGGPELDDAVAAADWLAENVPGVDRKRIGLWGWSYGGFLACQAAGRTPDAFAAHVAIAPVTEWEHYDTHYTEERLGTPQGEPEAYTRSNPITYASKVKNPLLVIHGLKDDNVHAQDTWRYVDALVQAGVDFDLMIYPEALHGIRRDSSRIHLFSKMLQFFDRHLAPEPPAPADVVDVEE